VRGYRSNVGIEAETSNLFLNPIPAQVGGVCVALRISHDVRCTECKALKLPVNLRKLGSNVAGACLN